MRVDTLLLASTVVALAQASAPSYPYLQPARRYGGSSKCSKGGAPASWNSLKDLDVKGIVSGAVAAPKGLAPVKTSIVPTCNTNETYAYWVNNTVMITSGSSNVSVTGMTGTVYLSCLTTTLSNKTSAHLYDLQLRNVTLQPNGTAQADADFAKPFQVLRSLSGSILSVQVDTTEKPEVASIKKAIAENFQTSFQYPEDGIGAIDENGVMASRTTRYMAVGSKDNARVAIAAKYTNADVKKFAGQGKTVAFIARTNAIVDGQGVIHESLDRTHATLTGQNVTLAQDDNAAINVHGASDVVFLHAISRKAAVASNLHARSSNDDGHVWHVTALDGSLLTVPAVAAPALQRRDSSAPRFTSEGLVSTGAATPNEYNYADIVGDLLGGQKSASLAVRASRYADDATVNAIIELSHRAAPFARRDGSDVSPILNALAATGHSDAHHALVDHAVSDNSIFASHARNALIFAREPSMEIVRRVAEADGVHADMSLVLGSLLEKHTAAIARRHIEPIVKRASQGNEEAKFSALLAVGNMGSNAEVVKTEVLGWARDASASADLRVAVRAALSGAISMRPSPVSGLARRAASDQTLSTNWAADDHAHDLLEDLATRQADVKEYTAQRSFVVGKTIGWSELNLDVAAGAFGGSETNHCLGGAQKFLARVRGNVNAFGHTAPLADAFATATRSLTTGIAARAYVQLAGKTVTQIGLSIDCQSNSIPLFQASTPVLPITFAFPVYVVSVDVGIELSAGVEVDLDYAFCPDTTTDSVGSISLRNTVSGTVAGTAGVSILGMRGGLLLAGTTSLTLGPEAHMGDNPALTAANNANALNARGYNTGPKSYSTVAATSSISSTVAVESTPATKPNGYYQGPKKVTTTPAATTSAAPVAATTTAAHGYYRGPKYASSSASVDSSSTPAAYSHKSIPTSSSEEVSTSSSSVASKTTLSSSAVRTTTAATTTSASSSAAEETSSSTSTATSTSTK
ncbi:hypothetical protein HKX48_001632, partial [Thoreauomyces humboldtii]